MVQFLVICVFKGEGVSCVSEICIIFVTNVWIPYSRKARFFFGGRGWWC